VTAWKWVRSCDSNMTIKPKEQRLSIIIVNWNRSEDLRLLLQDLQVQEDPAKEIIIVDNGSTDGSVKMVQSEYPNAHLIKLSENKGLSFGRNQGIKAASSELMVILDNDLRILDRFFTSKVKESVTRHPDCGIISFQQVIGIWSHPKDGFNGEVVPWPLLVAMAEADKSPFEKRAFYEWFFWGGASVIRKEVFRTLGLFDEVFRYGGEEWDFSYRCHATGIRLLRDTSLWVVHTLSPKMRPISGPKTGKMQILKYMAIAQSRYMPWPDLIWFLGIQFASSLWQSVKSGATMDFAAICIQIIRGWRSQVLSKRQPVSRETMRRFYYLRTHYPEDFRDVEKADTSLMGFYCRQAKNRVFNEAEKPLFVSMLDYEKGCGGESRCENRESAL